ncbi:MAG: N-formylglutamate deformylase [Alphaproteobacteria bacterium]
MRIFRFRRGRTPLLISMPHVGTHVPPELVHRFSPEALILPDTDWHLEQLYDFAGEVGAGLLIATHARYVVDLNRPPDDKPLYAGADNTELCPTTSFERAPIYLKGDVPDEKEIARRTETYWRPYHDKLAAELRALKEEFGVAVMLEAHSIRSRLPRFFEGKLPDLNLGTADGASASGEFAERLFEVCLSAGDFTTVLNGRFKGGYITRAYGRPANGIHAVQLELAQCTYMEEEPPFLFVRERAAKLRPVLRSLVENMVAWAEEWAARPD